MTPRRKILQISSYPPPRAGWAVRVEFLKRQLLAEGHDCVVLNIGTGVQTSTEELVATAERVTGRRIATAAAAHPGRAWDTADWVSDPGAAARLLGWTPTVGLAEGLARTWASL